MSTKFGGRFPSSTQKVNQRDRLMFLAVVGLVVSLVLMIFLFSAKAKQGNSALEDSAANSESVNAAVGTITLYAANKRIPSGSKLENFKFKSVYWPRNSVPEQAVRDLAELRGMYASKNIPAGVPIQRSHLTDTVSVETLPITPGMRAVTIPVDEKSGIEGWAQPGASVDVVLTYTQDTELKSKIIVENARVLSSGGDSRSFDERMTGNRKQVQAQRTITLEVSPPDALKVQTSMQLGKLALIMRSKLDEQALSVTEMGSNDIDGKFPGTSRKRTCNNGKMRVGGQEYIIDCDGSLTQLVNPNEP